MIFDNGNIVYLECLNYLDKFINEKEFKTFLYCLNISEKKEYSNYKIYNVNNDDILLSLKTYLKSNEKVKFDFTKFKNEHISSFDCTNYENINDISLNNLLIFYKNDKNEFSKYYFLDEALEKIKNDCLKKGILKFEENQKTYKR